MVSNKDKNKVVFCKMLSFQIYHRSVDFTNGINLIDFNVTSLTYLSISKARTAHLHNTDRVDRLLNIYLYIFAKHLRKHLRSHQVYTYILNQYNQRSTVLLCVSPERKLVSQYKSHIDENWYRCFLLLHAVYNSERA